MIDENNPKHPPAFQFYPSDFSSDSHVEAMSTEAVGAYILLLCKAWREDPPGTIPDDDTRLARWTRMSPEAWKGIREAVLAPFRPDKYRPGRLVQKRMALEFKAMMRRREERAQSGKKGADNRWKRTNPPVNIQTTPPVNFQQDSVNRAVNADRNASRGWLEKLAPDSSAILLPIAKHGSSSSSSSVKDFKESLPAPPGGTGGEKSVTVPRPKKPTSTPPGFERFWNAYRKHFRGDAKAGALKTWIRDGLEELTETILENLRWRAWDDQWTREDGRFSPYAQTYLNQRRWEDSPPPAIAERLAFEKRMASKNAGKDQTT